MSRYKRTGFNVWMKVTQDEYELPIIVADSALALAQKCGTSVNNIHSSWSKYHTGRHSSSPYRKVRIDADDE